VNLAPFLIQFRGGVPLYLVIPLFTQGQALRRQESSPIGRERETVIEGSRMWRMDRQDGERCQDEPLEPPGPYLVDLHCHTRHSYDNLLDPLDLMHEAGALGLYGVGIVEPNSFRASAPCERLAPSMGVQRFRGVEIATDLGHLLAFGLRDDSWGLWGRHDFLPLGKVLPFSLRAHDSISLGLCDLSGEATATSGKEQRGVIE
jgi:hypothetical protein